MSAKHSLNGIRRQLDALDRAEASGCPNCVIETFKVIDYGNPEAAEKELPEVPPCLNPTDCLRHVARVVFHCHRPPDAANEPDVSFDAWPASKRSPKEKSDD